MLLVFIFSSGRTRFPLDLFDSPGCRHTVRVALRAPGTLCFVFFSLTAMESGSCVYFIPPPGSLASGTLKRPCVPASFPVGRRLRPRGAALVEGSPLVAASSPWGGVAGREPSGGRGQAGRTFLLYRRFDNFFRLFILPRHGTRRQTTAGEERLWKFSLSRLDYLEFVVGMRLVVCDV